MALFHKKDLFLTFIPCMFYVKRNKSHACYIFYITKSLRLYTVEVYSVRASVFIDHSITNMVCFSETISVCVLATTE